MAFKNVLLSLRLEPWVRKIYKYVAFAKSNILKDINVFYPK